MEEFPPVSAMCLTYGRPQLLEEAIESFLRQDYNGPKELVILNDRSDQMLVFDHPEVRIINVFGRFRTVGEKRNACAALCKHDLLFVWDDDDIYLPWRLSISVCRLDATRGFYKSSRAWVLNDDKLSGPATNGFHSGSCFCRTLFDKVKGYPHIGSGQDWGIEHAFDELVSPPKDDRSLKEEDLYYIYRWEGTGSYHLSGFGRDEGQSVAGNEKVADFVDRELKCGRMLTGTINISPHWRKDYEALIASALRAYRGAETGSNY